MDCRKHNHQGNKGVCPSCLREKLSRLPNTTTSYYIIHRSDFSNSSSVVTVDSSSSPSSPVKDHHRRAGSMSMSFAVREALSGNLIEGLKKSRSMAHHHHVQIRDSFLVKDSKTKKTTEKLKSTAETAKKKGFWTKLLHLKGKSGGGSDVGGLVTSRQRVY